jgi:hypothetical protein
MFLDLAVDSAGLILHLIASACPEYAYEYENIIF